MYLGVKTFHLITVAISISLFLFRFFRYYTKPEITQPPAWLKYLPHFNDTLLFSSGIALVSITKFVPFTAAAPWLSYKLLAVFLYILCGFFAMSKKSGVRARWFYFAAAVGWLIVVISLAISKQISMINPF